jgi:hypothetical protein
MQAVGGLVQAVISTAFHPRSLFSHASNQSQDAPRGAKDPLEVGRIGAR